MDKLVVHELLEFEADHLWISENIETLLDEYPDQWIAVKNERVVANDTDLDKLLSRLTDPANTCIEFITREPLEMLL